MSFLCAKCVRGRRFLPPAFVSSLLFIPLLLTLVLAASPAWAQSSVPSPWTAQDIARPTPSGRTTYNAGVFTLAAGGADIANRSDSFHFVYQPLSGDTRIVARVDNLIPADPASKIGLMIRGSLTATAPHAFVYLNAVNRVAYGRRRTDNARMVTTTPTAAWSAPVWLSLTRTGSTVVAAVSADSRTWTTIGSDTITLGTTAYVGLAIVAHSSTSAAQADVSNVQLANGLPGTMADADIGGPAIAGTARYNAGVYTVTGNGDTLGSSDQFHYVYQPVSGDVDVSVRLASLSSANIAAKAGVMVRASLAANAAHAFSMMMGTLGAGMLDRTATGGTTEFITGGSAAAPVWLRVVRSGSRLEAYRSPNGTTWSLMASQTIAMGTTVYVGLAVTSHSSTDTATAAFDNFVVANVVAPTPNQPPTVTLTSPANGASAVAPGSWTLSANAADPEGRLARVDFLVNGQLVASDTAAPFTATWSNVPAGSYAVTAVAVDQDGGQATSAAATVVVSAPNQPPTVSLTSPAANSTATAPATLTVTAAASDPEGRLARVEFFANGQRFSTVTTAPYTTTWSGVATGNYTLTAVATDDAGLQATSSSVAVTVTPALPPTLQDLDIGAPTTSGSVRYSSGTYTVAGAGLDIIGTSDQFHFVYQPLTGDVDVSVRVASFVANNMAARAGLMVRESLNGNSAHAFSMVMSALGSGMMIRSATGASIDCFNNGTANAPIWLRLVRSGARFDAYRSTDGTAWTLMSTQYVTMAPTVYVGMAVTSRNATEIATAAFDHYQVASAPVVPPTNQAPAVTLLTPLNGSTAVAPAAWTVAASASDPEGRLARVEFYVNGQLLGSRTASPFSLAWTGVTAGTYAVLAVAYDQDGASTSSTAAVVRVTAPVVTQRLVTFTASPDHDFGLTSYRLNVYAGADTGLATTLVSYDVGKPTPDATRTITVDGTNVIAALPPGNYLATMSAVGPGGSTPSAPYAFTR